MSTPMFRTAERRQAKIRIGLFGPSGSGKTMGALRIARGLASSWEKVFVIDTENKSAELYAHLGPFQTAVITPPFTPEAYIEMIKGAEAQGAEVVVVDSITHEWAGTGGILEMADQMAKDSRNNSYVAWAKLTPRHNKFIDAILQSPCHIIACGRSKQEYALNQVEKNGKTVSVPEKLGLKAVTREGFDYEMTVAFEIPISHLAVSTKDRTGLFQDKPERLLDEQVGVQIKNWSETGAVDPLHLKRDIMRHLRRLGWTDLTDREVIRVTVKALTDVDLVDANLQSVLDKLAMLTPEEAQGRAPTQQAKVMPKPPEPPAAAAGGEPGSGMTAGEHAEQEEIDQDEPVGLRYICAVCGKDCTESVYATCVTSGCRQDASTGSLICSEACEQKHGHPCKKLGKDREGDGGQTVQFESTAEDDARKAAERGVTPSPTAPIPAGGAIDTPPRPIGMSPAGAMMHYQKRIEAATTLAELDAVYGEWTLDKVVLGSPVVTSTLTGLNEKKLETLMGNAPKASILPQDASKPENEVEVVQDENAQARPLPASQAKPQKPTGKIKRGAVKPSVAPPSGKCGSCDGTGSTPTGDCPSCDGTGIPKH